MTVALTDLYLQYYTMSMVALNSRAPVKVETVGQIRETHHYLHIIVRDSSSYNVNNKMNGHACIFFTGNLILLRLKRISRKRL